MKKIAMFGHMLPDMKEVLQYLPEGSEIAERVKNYVSIPSDFLFVTVCTDGDFKVVLPESLQEETGAIVISPEGDEHYTFGIPLADVNKQVEIFDEFMAKVEIHTTREKLHHTVRAMFAGASEDLHDNSTVDHYNGNFSIHIELIHE